MLVLVEEDAGKEKSEVAEGAGGIKGVVPKPESEKGAGDEDAWRESGRD